MDKAVPQVDPEKKSLPLDRNELLGKELIRHAVQIAKGAIVDVRRHESFNDVEIESQSEESES